MHTGSLVVVSALLVLGFVLPPEKILRVMATERKKASPLRVEFLVSSPEGSDARPLYAELHPDRGVRLTSDEGERWLLRDGRVRGSEGAPTGWVPELDIVLLRGEEALADWLRSKAIDVDISQLARCGEADCFVIGGRKYANQLWVDKDHFDVRRFQKGRDHVVELTGWDDRDGVRFPERIVVSDERGPILELETRSVSPAPDLDQADFSPRWLLHAPG